MDNFMSRHAQSVLLGNDRQCTATSKTTGVRCGRSSAFGQFICDKHGAKAPLSIAAANQRMALLLYPALGVLDRATRQAPPCAKCGRSDADRDPAAIRAAQIILDRAGFGPSATMNVVAAANPYRDLSPDDLVARLEQLLDTARALRDSKRAAAIDADVYTVPEEAMDGTIADEGLVAPERTTKEGASD